LRLRPASRKLDAAPAGRVARLNDTAEEDDVRRSSPALMIGVFLILLGVLLLLENVGLLRGGAELAVAAGFALGGVAFLWGYASQREWWWAAIPGMALLGIGLLIGYSTMIDEEGELGASLFLGSLAVGFLLVYLRTREQWWALIPGGVLLTIAAIVSLEPVFGDDALGGVFFLGLALTFLIVYLVPTPEGQMKWALIPAGVLGVMGALLMAGSVGLLGYIWPLALMAVGAVLLVRALQGSSR